MGTDKPSGSQPSTTTGTNPPAMAPPGSAPADAFAAMTVTASDSGSEKRPALVPARTMDNFKRTILEVPTLSKLGIVELMCAKLPGVTKNQVRNTLDVVAEQTGSRGAKTWKLKPGFEM